VALPSIDAWIRAPVVLQAKHETLRTTRVWFWCAALMIEVIFELVQPAQPVVNEPSGLYLSRYPDGRQPTLK
jgi:hypothetical protein